MKYGSTHNARSILMAVTAGLALSVAGAVALAQPGGGHNGMHGGGGDQIGGLLAHAKDRLNLNTSQQALFDNAAAQSKAAHESARASRQQVKAAVQAELAKPEPDLAAIAAASDNAEQQNRATRQSIRNQWLQLYATFTPEQKAVVKDMLQKRLQRAESFGEKMRERFHGAQPNG